MKRAKRHFLPFQPNHRAAVTAFVARELRAPFPEQAYGCQNEHIETAAGDSRLCRDLQPALSAPVSRAVLDACRLACAPEPLAKAKAEYQDRHTGPHEHPL